jgi:hypothetical protein
MALGILFGILNCLAATRRFSGSNCIRYLNGCWGGSYDLAARIRAEAQRTLNRLDPIVVHEGTREEKNLFFQSKSRLIGVVEEVSRASQELSGPRLENIFEQTPDDYETVPFVRDLEE